MRIFNTLKYRILISAIVMVMLMLPLIGFTISNAYEKHMLSAIKSELTAYSYSILANAEVENGQLLMPEQLLENRFNVGESGLYALVTQMPKKPINNVDHSATSNDIVWRTDSFLGLTEPKFLPIPAMGDFSFRQLDLFDDPHFLLSLSVNFSETDVNEGIQDTPLTLHILYKKDLFENQLNEFKQKLWLVLIIFILAIMLFQIVWLSWTLKPLTTLKQQITAVEKGDIDHVDGNYPEELQRVTEQLNRLLATEQHQRTRYRNALSDLAHSLKTPLAVIQSQSDLSAITKDQLTSIDRMVEHQLKRAQSAGQSAWHLGIDITPIAQKLINSLQKIYHDKALNFVINIEPLIKFKGEEADLFEIMGNLLDNAAKAAKSTVKLSSGLVNNHLIISIEDDGPGIAADKIDSIFKRGMRADTYESGHGIGLAIVRDLVKSYQGSVDINPSGTLGGARFILQFQK